MKAESAPESFDRAEILRRIETVLDEDVRKDLEADGGSVAVVGIDDDRIVQVRLGGACQGCPSSGITLTMSIEAALKAKIPQIRFIEAVP